MPNYEIPSLTKMLEQTNMCSNFFLLGPAKDEPGPYLVCWLVCLGRYVVTRRAGGNREVQLLEPLT